MPTPQDITYLYQLEMAAARDGLWRFRGALPSPEIYFKTFWEGVAATYVVVGRGDESVPLGVVTVHDLNLTNGTAEFSQVLVPEARRTTVAAESALMMLAFAFDVWPLRKVYCKVLEPNMDQFRSMAADHLFVEEGRLGRHVRTSSGYVDEVTLAMYDQSWARRGRLAARYVTTSDNIGDILGSDPQRLTVDAFLAAARAGLHDETLELDSDLTDSDRSVADIFILADLTQELLGRRLEHEFIEHVKTPADLFSLLMDEAFDDH